MDLAEIMKSGYFFFTYLFFLILDHYCGLLIISRVKTKVFASFFF